MGQLGILDGVKQLKSRHRLLDTSRKYAHVWGIDILAVNEEWEFDLSPELSIVIIDGK